MKITGISPAKSCPVQSRPVPNSASNKLFLPFSAFRFPLSCSHPVPFSDSTPGRVRNRDQGSIYVHDYFTACLPACLPAQLCAVSMRACALIMFNDLREGMSIGGYQLGMSVGDTIGDTIMDTVREGQLGKPRGCFCHCHTDNSLFQTTKDRSLY